jgi:hypothetical protein
MRAEDAFDAALLTFRPPNLAGLMGQTRRMPSRRIVTFDNTRHSSKVLPARDLDRPQKPGQKRFGGW